jgi:hypothetical protein
VLLTPGGVGHGGAAGEPFGEPVEPVEPLEPLEPVVAVVAAVVSTAASRVGCRVDSSQYGAGSVGSGMPTRTARRT